MSRSLRALAEGCAWTVSAVRGLGSRARDRQASRGSDRIGAGTSFRRLKWMAVIGVVALAFAPATALAKTPHRQPSTAQPKTQDAAAPAPRSPILAFGAGYADAHGSASVRALQRRLTAAGYAPGPIDGLYGPRTEHAVIDFQAAHGLQVDGIAGPHTLAALTQPILYPDAGYADTHGSASVRALQRRLTAAGYAPGPVDGLYGPRTEHAVIDFQAAHSLRVDGIAGQHTLVALRVARPNATTRSARMVAHSRTATKRGRTAPAGGRRPLRTAPAVAPTAGSARGANRSAHRTPGSTMPLGWLVLIYALGAAALLAVVRTRWRKRRRATAIPMPPPDRNHPPPLRGYRVLELRILPDSPARGRRLADIDWPPGSTVAAVTQGRKIRFARPELKLQAGDRAIVLVPSPEKDQHRLGGASR